MIKPTDKPDKIEPNTPEGRKIEADFEREEQAAVLSDGDPMVVYEDDNE